MWTRERPIVLVVVMDDSLRLGDQDSNPEKLLAF